MVSRPLGSTCKFSPEKTGVATGAATGVATGTAVGAATGAAPGAATGAPAGEAAGMAMGERYVWDAGGHVHVHVWIGCVRVATCCAGF